MDSGTDVPADIGPSLLRVEIMTRGIGRATHSAPKSYHACCSGSAKMTGVTPLFRYLDASAFSLVLMAWLAFFVVMLVMVLTGRRRRTGLGRINLVLALVAIASVTVVRQPTTWDMRAVNLEPLQTIGAIFSSDGTTDTAIWQVAGNALMFMPVGFFAVMAMVAPRFWRAVGLCAGVAIVIEAIQWVFNLGSADIDDVILAAVGGVIGAGVALAALGSHAAVLRHAGATTPRPSARQASDIRRS